MEFSGNGNEQLLIAGEGRLIYSVTVCMIKAGHPVTLFTGDKEAAASIINHHLNDLRKNDSEDVNHQTITITNDLDSELSCELVIVITDEDVSKKKMLIRQLEEKLPRTSIIAINTESIPLSVLQKDCLNGERIIGVNWSEPAHTTYFIEIIANNNCNIAMVEALSHRAKTYWNKDPYIIYGDLGIRAKLLSAMTREAFYLLENGFASIEDIDRACRNDPGYYLPFAGNFRYIDLMGGPIAYGRVMKTLNPELSKSNSIPGFMIDIIKQAEQSPGGSISLYEYSEGERQKWEETFRKYSYQVQAIVKKYS